MARLQEIEAEVEGVATQQRAFSFLEVTAEPGDKAKAAQRRAVRSNAAKHRWNQIKSKSGTLGGKVTSTLKNEKGEDTASRRRAKVTGYPPLLGAQAALASVLPSLPKPEHGELMKLSGSSQWCQSHSSV